MQDITHVYIDGRFVEPHGTELFDLHNPPTGEVPIASCDFGRPEVFVSQRERVRQMLRSLRGWLRLVAGPLRGPMASASPGPQSGPTTR